MAKEQKELTPGKCYGHFMVRLLDLEDIAALSGYSERGQKLLSEARKEFWGEFTERHPNQWSDEK
ncbi:hypothetical protein [Parasphingopyxis sp.]|uniref:hypothetical protein n=1 Tax=Parasphingopyxis sp. TaxID=1920299 RepID=UPI00261F0AD7|nr:hypothetical protein [Parasphingopyxis sp.]